ncbi:hypothetical protein AB1L42_15605 [Thalassoglobus sp. JC818]|uniref:hypothetical protein n=1 Tax=Thalassoglobus sp. JC818 TaxID=3232136 RepID=UPI0034592369
MRGNGLCVSVYRTQRARQLALIDWFSALAEQLHNVRIVDRAGSVWTPHPQFSHCNGKPE